MIIILLSLLDWKGAYLSESLAYCSNFERKKSAKLSVNVCNSFIGDGSEPPSDKLGGEVFIASCAFVLCLSLYIYGYVWPDNQYHAHSQCVRTLTLIQGIAQRKPNNNAN